VGNGCKHSVENCLTFAPFEGAFDDGGPSRPITKEEAYRILNEAATEGLVHSTGNYRKGTHYICNCCTCSCGIVRGLTEYDIPTAVARADFRMTVNEELCTGCMDCVDRCQFNALDVPDAVCEVDWAACLGCGACAVACFEEAMQLERRPKGEVPKIPGGIKDWMLKRAKNRDISIFEVM
jgi:ferredoxin